MVQEDKIMRKNFLFALTAALAVTVMQPQMFLMAEEMEGTSYEDEYETGEHNDQDEDETGDDDYQDEYETGEDEENTVEELGQVKKVSVAPDTFTKLTVSWETVENAAGYEIQYATKSNFANAQVITVGNRTERKIKGLKKGSKYYIRVRAYADGSDDTIYGDYSSKVSVNIAKTAKARTKESYEKFLKKKKTGYFVIKDLDKNGVKELVYCKKMSSPAKLFTYNMAEQKVYQPMRYDKVWIDVDKKKRYCAGNSSGLSSCGEYAIKKNNLWGENIHTVSVVDLGETVGYFREDKVKGEVKVKRISKSKFKSMQKKYEASFKNAGKYLVNNAANRKKALKKL